MPDTELLAVKQHLVITADADEDDDQIVYVKQRQRMSNKELDKDYHHLDKLS